MLLMLAFLAEPSRTSINQRLLIRQLEVCSVVWIRGIVSRHVPLRGVGGGLGAGLDSLEPRSGVHESLPNDSEKSLT